LEGERVMKRKLFIFLAFVMVLSIVPVVNAQADTRRPSPAAEARASARAAASTASPSALDVVNSLPGVESNERNVETVDFLFRTFYDGTDDSLTAVLGQSLGAVSSEPGFSEQGARSIMEGLDALAGAMGR
jgi:hypothetical protein